MMDKYREKSAEFFDLLALPVYSAVREAFLEMTKECALNCAIEAADNPSVGVGQWSGGRISICREWSDGVESALARAKGKAKPDAEAGLAYPPV